MSDDSSDISVDSYSDYISSREMTRRDFMKWMGATAGSTVVMGSLSGCDSLGSLWKRQPVIDVEEWHKGVCRFCGTGCGIEIGTNDGEVVDVKGDEQAHNKGRLCIKGILNREILYADDRAQVPMIRENGSLREASWEEAMDKVVSEFRKNIDRHGPDSVAFYGSGQLFTQESYTANKLFKAGIGTNNVEGNPRLCMASAAAGYTSTFGKDEPSGCYEDIDHATCFFVTGSNMAECHPIVWERLMDRKNSRPQTPIIVVDPRKTMTAEEADIHLAIEPGTDVALHLGLMNIARRDGLLDEEMVDQYLTFKAPGTGQTSYEAWADHVSDYTPQRVEDITGVSRHDIERVAELFITSDATMSFWTMGLNQQTQGTAANRSLMGLHLLTGHIGIPGATPFSLTGQPNAGGGVRDTGALSHALPNGRAVSDKEDRREMETLWDVPEGSIAPEPGYHTVDLFDAMRNGDVKATLIMCTNPAQSMPNAEDAREAMDECFTVAVDAFHPTETTKRADVVLPSAMWTEKEGVFSQSERRYHMVPKTVDPPGQARADLDILTEFADRLGHGDVISARTPETVWEEWRKISAHSPYDFSGITYERLQEERGILWPCPDEDHPGTCRRYVPDEDPIAEGDGRFDFYGRDDGRAVIWLDEQEPPAEPTDDEYPLQLTTGRVLEQWHTNTITGGVDDLKEIDVDFAEIHPRDARRNGILDGEPVEIESRRGSVEFEARVTEDIRPGVVFTTFHSAKHLVNNATQEAHDPYSKQPAFKKCAVSISSVT